jgi:hypothetical protein
MTFSKSFPRTLPGSTYPVWEEIFLTQDEEDHVEAACKKQNFFILDECLQEAKALAIKQSMNEEAHVVQLAIALFEKRASHVVFWKESKAKQKFDQK